MTHVVFKINMINCITLFFTSEIICHHDMIHDSRPYPWSFEINSFGGKRLKAQLRSVKRTTKTLLESRAFCLILKTIR